MYCIPAGWLWNSNGFLKQLGVVDIAGSGGVHLVGGSSGRPKASRNIPKTLDLIDNSINRKEVLINIYSYTVLAIVAAYMLGPRLGRWDDVENAPPMGSPTNALVGLFMLWWGWLAFNAGR